MEIYFNPKPSKTNPKRKRCVELPDAAITLKGDAQKTTALSPFILPSPAQIQ